jgi:hypothetical protein
VEASSSFYFFPQNRNASLQNRERLEREGGRGESERERERENEYAREERSLNAGIFHSRHSIKCVLEGFMRI